MQRDELRDWLRLSLTPRVGNETSRKLLAAFGLPQSIFEQSGTALRQVVTEAQANALRTEPPMLAALLEVTWAWLQGGAEGAGVRQIVALSDADYPAALLNIEDPPLMLYLLGAGELIRKVPKNVDAIEDVAPHSVAHHLKLALVNSVALVGSRNPTPQGGDNAHQFARALGEAGLCVVSGLALGIDGAAHEGALDSLYPGEARLATVAVVGTGLDRVYPRGHLALAHRIAQHGVLISEYPLGTPPLPANFPKRNRLIAGLAQGTLVVEAALKSGSLITARLCAEQGKEVFAIPGSIHATQARGCHALIRQGAKLVESAQDVLEELKLVPRSELATFSIAPKPIAERLEPLLDSEQALLDAMGFDPVGLDALQARCDVETASLQAQLLTLELDGLVARLPGGLFQRLGRGDVAVR